jgi:hypothetical protein
LHSVSKSIVGLLYGIAQREGKVPPLDEPLLAQFPNYTDLPNLEQRRRWSRVRGTFRAPSPAGSFLGGFRTTALVLAAPSRWAVIRNPEHKRQSVDRASHVCSIRDCGHRSFLSFLAIILRFDRRPLHAKPPQTILSAPDPAFTQRACFRAKHAVGHTASNFGCVLQQGETLNACRN